MPEKKGDKTVVEPPRLAMEQSMIIAGLSESYLFGNPMDLAGQWNQFMPYIDRISRQKSDVAYGLCFDLEDGKGIEYVCGIEVSGIEVLPDQLVYKQLPASRYAVFPHYGHVSSIRQTIDSIRKKWLPESSYWVPDDADYFFERYGEQFDAQTGTGDIEIWIPVETQT